MTNPPHELFASDSFRAPAFWSTALIGRWVVGEKGSSGHELFFGIYERSKWKEIFCEGYLRSWDPFGLIRSLWRVLHLQEMRTTLVDAQNLGIVLYRDPKIEIDRSLARNWTHGLTSLVSTRLVRNEAGDYKLDLSKLSRYNWVKISCILT